MWSRKTTTLETTDIEKELMALYGKLLRYAHTLTRDCDRANDLMQDTALKVLVGKEKFKDGTDFEKWARAIMRNAYINQTNREKRMLAVEELRHTDSCSIFTARCSSTSEYNDICNAVNRLPDGRRETMRLLIHGHKYNEIAFVMDIPIGTVKSRINCSRIILKEVLKDYMA